mmetsp:Transcript_414/g.972  ORF Transcript_414/g.972 Transcript_414/m.972 type:complete len:236 (-) Transcript_414:1485-2192(-)
MMTQTSTRMMRKSTNLMPRALTQMPLSKKAAKPRLRLSTPRPPELPGASRILLPPEFLEPRPSPLKTTSLRTISRRRRLSSSSCPHGLMVRRLKLASLCWLGSRIWLWTFVWIRLATCLIFVLQSWLLAAASTKRVSSAALAGALTTFLASSEDVVYAFRSLLMTLTPVPRSTTSVGVFARQLIVMRTSHFLSAPRPNADPQMARPRPTNKLQLNPLSKRTLYHRLMTRRIVSTR